LSRLQQGLKTKNPLRPGAKVALSAAWWHFLLLPLRRILKEGITPATDASQIPASQAAQRHGGGRDLRAAGIFNPYFVNGWDENVTNVIFHA
jgi:peptide/nickel transport system substrate-binding protein